MDTQLQRRKIRAAKDGDMEAFAEVFEELRGTIHAVAYRVAGPNEADDVVMETFLKAWRALPRFDERSSLKTWLYRITRNCAIDQIRARQRRPESILRSDEQDDRTIDDLPDKDQRTAPESIIRGEERHWVEQGVERLEEPHRTTLLLRYADGLSYAEIAAATGVSMGTVMSRLFHAKRKLKRILETIEG